ncbi:MAG TPA: right-handed parallel beta-helix repeat-containing protein [Acidimicrobiia bacterium]|nr:right-handed parallel beta-helix repeat-containing protein [Acidimicrobiia bacterium]
MALSLIAGFMGVGLVACSPSADELPSPPSLPEPTSIPSTTVSSTSTTMPEEVDDVILLALGDDFASIVDAAPEGSEFIIGPGVHRLQEIEPRDGMTFEGRPGAVMNGAIELDSWTEDGPGVWRFDGISKTAFEHGECISGYEGCRLSQDVYMDDVMLWQVTARGDLGPGSWFWDGDRILVADDPTSRRVELSLATHAFFGEASDITIRDLVIEKYAVPAQFGAIQSERRGGGPHGRGWLVEDVELRLNHGAGVRMGDDTVLRRLFVHHNGQLGIAASGGDGGLVEDSEIASNNLAGFRWGWEAGGAKFKETTGLVVRRNVVRDNNGPGLWTDIDNDDTLYEDNVVTGNVGPGIFHEISYSAVIRNNTVRGNGHDSGVWLWGAGILVAASSDTEVHGNIVEGNANGITLIQQDRGSGSLGPRIVRNVTVRDNVVSGGKSGAVQDIGDNSIFSANNTFLGNSYSDVEGWAWDNSVRLGWSAWQGKGNDTSGSYSR